MLSTLKDLGYSTVELLLTPLQFGIPNSRLRYYLLAKMTPLTFPCKSGQREQKIWRHIPGHGNDWLDTRLDSLDSDDAVEHLSKYLDEDVESNEPHQHVVSDRVLQKWGKLFDIVKPNSQRTCCFTRGDQLAFNSVRSQVDIDSLPRIHSAGRTCRFCSATQRSS